MIYTLLPSLMPSEKNNICQLIRAAILELHTTPPPEYLSGLNHQPHHDAVLWNGNNDPATSGSLSSQAEMNKGLLRRLDQSEDAEYVRLLQIMVDKALHGHPTGFSHGDLQPKNIMVERTGSRESWSPIFRITLTD